MAPTDDKSEYPTSGWDRWSKHVLKELERLNAAIDTLAEKVDKINTDKISTLEKEMAVLKTRVLLMGTGVAMVISFAVSIGMRFIK